MDLVICRTHFAEPPGRFGRLVLQFMPHEYEMDKSEKIFLKYAYAKHVL